MKLVLFLLPFAGAMVCPPADKEALKANLKREGEPCGGACDSLGWCADGLECVVPKTSSMSFAILLTPARSGICRGPVEEETPTNAGVPGGISKADVDEAILGAARFCVDSMNAQSNSLTPPTMSRVVSATKQVVAGIKYRIKVEMSDGHQHEFDIVEQAWMTPRYNLLASRYNVEQ